MENLKKINCPHCLKSLEHQPEIICFSTDENFESGFFCDDCYFYITEKKYFSFESFKNLQEFADKEHENFNHKLDKYINGIDEREEKRIALDKKYEEWKKEMEIKNYLSDVQNLYLFRSKRKNLCPVCFADSFFCGDDMRGFIPEIECSAEFPHKDAHYFCKKCNFSSSPTDFHNFDIRGYLKSKKENEELLNIIESKTETETETEYFSL